MFDFLSDGFRFLAPLASCAGLPERTLMDPSPHSSLTALRGSTALKVLLLAGGAFVASRQWKLNKSYRELTERVSTDSSKMRRILCLLREKEDEVDSLKMLLRESEVALRERPRQELLIEELRKRGNLCEKWGAGCELRGEIGALREQLRDYARDKEAFSSRMNHLENEKQKVQTEVCEMREKLRTQDEVFEERAAEITQIKRRARRRDEHIAKFMEAMRNMERQIRSIQQQMWECLREKEALRAELENFKRQKLAEEQVRQKVLLEVVQEVLKGRGMGIIKGNNKDCQIQQEDKEEEQSGELSKMRFDPEYINVYGKYEVGHLLGKGGFAEVRVARRRGDNIPPGEPNNYPLEVGLMKMTTASPPYPHVIQLLDWFIGPNYIAIVMELPKCPMNLAEFMMSQGGFLNEEHAKRIFSQVVDAICFCHACWVFHRDMKPDNILIEMTTGNVKLIDFGCGAILEPDEDYDNFAGEFEDNLISSSCVTLDKKPIHFYVSRHPVLCPAGVVGSEEVQSSPCNGMVTGGHDV
ncbi:PIM1 kinase, partial [Polypterus senegalus]|nr:PIM1 kinase [Polypterus senegalus]